MGRFKPTSGDQIPKQPTNTGAHTTLLASANTDTQIDASMNFTTKLVLTALAYIYRAKVSMMR